MKYKTFTFISSTQIVVYTFIYFEIPNVDLGHIEFKCNFSEIQNDKFYI